MSRGKCCSKRSNGICESCLVHGDHIHISLTEDQVLLPGCPCHIQSIQISALVKNLSFRRVQILRFAISHDTAAKTDHTVIDIHDRKDHTVPELVIHSMAFIYIEQTRFPKPVIAVSFGFEELIQATAKFI